ncbi:CidA/LrgA family protein [Aerococcaceae bacterium DSM 111020]|nr:CidA/LrgA family protein [Aerococcaceae bacterium DSM 111020]
MKLLKQLFLILLFSLLGEILSVFIRGIIAIPGSVIGMLLLFLALHNKWVKMEQIEEVGTWLTDNMAILFVPAGVALLTHFELLSSVWWQLLLIVIITVAITMGFVGILVQKMTRNRKENK